MLFNSYAFLLVFLPLVMLGYGACASLGSRRLGFSWLVLASFVYYGWWNPPYLIIIVVSLVFNYLMGLELIRSRGKRRARLTLTFGVVVNFLALGYFKYANFFLDTFNQLTGSGWELEKVLLPLGISFFTFTQVAYLVDVFRSEANEYHFVDYCLFVTFFPHLFAGPIVHHKEILPEFALRTSTWARERRQVGGWIWGFRSRDLAVGFSCFSIGLFKKVAIADNLAPYAVQIFTAAAGGQELTMTEAWLGALSFTFQLYFDFSGYSDMAIGLARIFGVRFPINFDSPYKSVNIIEFWRRWHVTLSRFLRDYLYIPLGGSRKGRVRRYANLWITMLLGGLWHGAGWTFIVWGAMHGTYLVINHAWHYLIGRELGRRADVGHERARGPVVAAYGRVRRAQRWWGWGLGAGRESLNLAEGRAGGGAGVGENTRSWIGGFPRAGVLRLGAMLLTFLAVVISWVVFRADNLSTASTLLGAMFGQGAYRWDATPVMGSGLARTAAIWVVLAWAIVWIAPNSQQIFGRVRPAPGVRYQPDCLTLSGRITRSLQWRPNLAWAFVTVSAFVYSFSQLIRVSEFIYYQF